MPGLIGLLDCGPSRLRGIPVAGRATIYGREGLGFVAPDDQTVEGVGSAAATRVLVERLATVLGLN